MLIRHYENTPKSRLDSLQPTMSSVNTTDAVYDSQSRRGGPFFESHHSSSGHKKSSKSSSKTKEKSGRGNKPKMTEAEKKQRQEEYLIGVGAQFDYRCSHRAYVGDRNHTSSGHYYDIRVTTQAETTAPQSASIANATIIKSAKTTKNAEAFTTTTAAEVALNGVRLAIMGNCIIYETTLLLGGVSQLPELRHGYPVALSSNSMPFKPVPEKITGYDGKYAIILTSTYVTEKEVGPGKHA
ncbi:hypothetical protein PG985_003731 [Apiospora marii]|uniref:Uncharacterized protein n=1 Tax=Apiospora marii TaxID=335849 RepID=A0ABR1SIZ0_9PEZI